MIKILFTFLAQVATHSDVNKMTPANLATVFGPNLLRSRDGSDSTGPNAMQECATVNDIIKTLIVQHSTIFQIAESRNRNFSSIPSHFEKTDRPGSRPDRPERPVRSAPAVLLSEIKEAQSNKQQQQQTPKTVPKFSSVTTPNRRPSDTPVAGFPTTVAPKPPVDRPMGIRAHNEANDPISERQTHQDLPPPISNSPVSNAEPTVEEMYALLVEERKIRLALEEKVALLTERLSTLEKRQ